MEFKKGFTYLSLFFMIWFIPSPIKAQEMVITNLRLKENKAVLVFNNAIKIRDIAITKINGKLRYDFPRFESNKKKIYSQIKTLNKNTDSLIIEGIANNKILENVSFLPVKFRVNDLKIIENSSTLKAFASVIFNESLEVECKVFSKEDECWVSWPSIRNNQNRRWRNVFSITDYRLREAVERAVIDRFKAYQKKK